MTTQASGQGYWERHAKRYDKSTRFLGRPVPRMLELCCEATRGSGRVLEVGAGTGLITTAIASQVGELVATDYAAAMVEELDARVRAAGLPNVTCEQADLYALRFEDGSFDAVVAANVLHLVPDLEGALASLRRVLKPGGRLIAPTYLHRETLGRPSFEANRGDGFRVIVGFLRLLIAALRRRFEVEKTQTIPGPFPIGFVAASS